MSGINPRSRMVEMAAFVLCATLFPEGRATAADKGPTASFEIKNDDLLIRVNWEPFIPVPATMRVLLPDGTVWAEGETDDDGKCAIPKPGTPYCKIEFKSVGVTSPPITLTFLDGGATVIPLVAPLEPGECCKEIRKQEASTSSNSQSAKNLRNSSAMAGRLSAMDLLLAFVMIGIPLLLILWDQQKKPRKGKKR